MCGNKKKPSGSRVKLLKAHDALIIPKDPHNQIHL
nr:MAG TPA: hypothetical protein [Caudoviricetes sp.]